MHNSADKSRIEIRYSKLYLIFYLFLLLAMIIACTYYTHFTDTIGGQFPKVVITLANIFLLYVPWLLIKQLLQNRIEILITDSSIGFYEGKDWEEVAFATIRGFGFKKAYEVNKMKKQLILELTNGEKKAIELNNLTTSQNELKNILGERVTNSSEADFSANN